MPSNKINSSAKGWLLDGNIGQMTLQLEDVAATFFYCGIMTFIINQQRRVYQKYLGQYTTTPARTISEYNPSTSWKLSPD
jgi:hypothetical protein